MSEVGAVKQVVLMTFKAFMCVKATALALTRGLNNFVTLVINAILVKVMAFKATN